MSYWSRSFLHYPAGEERAPVRSVRCRSLDPRPLLQPLHRCRADTPTCKVKHHIRRIGDRSYKLGNQRQNHLLSFHFSMINPAVEELYTIFGVGLYKKINMNYSLIISTVLSEEIYIYIFVIDWLTFSWKKSCFWKSLTSPLHVLALTIRSCLKSVRSGKAAAFFLGWVISRRILSIAEGWVEEGVGWRLHVLNLHPSLQQVMGEGEERDPVCPSKAQCVLQGKGQRRLQTLD